MGQLARDHHAYCIFAKDLAYTLLSLFCWEYYCDGRVDKFFGLCSMWLNRSSVILPISRLSAITDGSEQSSQTSSLFLEVKVCCSF